MEITAVKPTVWVLGDQLNLEIASLAGRSPADWRVLMVESRAKIESKPWHLQRAHLVVSAMAHFATELRELGFDVESSTMEDFYRWQRTRLDVLLDDGAPAGGRWNYDRDNREPPPTDGRPWPETTRFRLDAIDLEVLGRRTKSEPTPPRCSSPSTPAPCEGPHRGAIAAVFAHVAGRRWGIARVFGGLR